MDFLIVDDDRLICKGVEQRLREMNDIVQVNKVHSCYSGEEALAYLTETAVDVLISDIRMGEMNGLELIEQAKQVAPDMGYIVMTAYYDLEYARQALRLGVDDYLLKPSSVQEMRETVLRVVTGLSRRRGFVRSQLNTALLLGTHRPDVRPRALFAEHGVACPDKPYRLIAFGGNATGMFPAAPEEISVHPVTERYHLVWYPEKALALLRSWLDASARALGVPMGVSAADATLAEMTSQAAEALSLAWYWTEPKALFYAPPQHIRDEALLMLVRAVRTLHLSDAREQLRCLFAKGFSYGPSMALALYREIHTTFLQICMEFDLHTPDVPPLPAPLIGAGQAFDALLSAVESTVASMASEISLYPVVWAKRYARNHMDQAIDMAEIARTLKMSYTYFSKLFKDKTGVTFTEYLIDLRIHEAQRLLMRGISVSDAAQQVGYTSIYNFTRAFTKRCGIAPGKWRKNIMGILEPNIK